MSLENGGAESDVFHSPTSVAFYTPLKDNGPNDKRVLGGFGSAKRVLHKNRSSEKSGHSKSSTTPQSTRRRKDQGHYMKTTEASRYFRFDSKGITACNH